MNTLAKAILVAASALALTAGSASAAIVCNDDGDCWHVRGRPHFRPELKLRIYADDWKCGLTAIITGGASTQAGAIGGRASGST